MPGTPRHPQPLLEVRVRDLALEPPLTTLCAGYELGEWRSTHLAKHVLRWLPEFALKYSEWRGLDASDAVDLIGKAAQSIYNSDKYQNRGEFGEIFLHAIVRQCEGSIPAITKYFYKDSNNDTVKGFDAVHVVEADGGLELWLGEVKFYDDLKRAVRDVLDELEKHLKRNYLRSEFTAITNKIDDEWDKAASLRDLIAHNVSLDKIFKAVCVPILLTYDSDCIRANTCLSEEYTKSLEAEVRSNWERFAKAYRTLIDEKKLPETIRVRLYLLPLHTKTILVREMDEVLKKCQAIY
jgi:hypothetical protein